MWKKTIATTLIGTFLFLHIPFGTHSVFAQTKLSNFKTVQIKKTKTLKLNRAVFNFNKLYASPKQIPTPKPSNTPFVQNKTVIEPKDEKLEIQITQIEGENVTVMVLGDLYNRKPLYKFEVTKNKKTKLVKYSYQRKTEFTLSELGFSNRGELELDLHLTVRKSLGNDRWSEPSGEAYLVREAAYSKDAPPLSVIKNIKYYLADIPDDLQPAIRSVMEELKTYGIQSKEVDDEDANLVFGQQTTGVADYQALAYDENKRVSKGYINLNEDAIKRYRNAKGVVIHEILHFFGMSHQPIHLGELNLTQMSYEVPLETFCQIDVEWLKWRLQTE